MRYIIAALLIAGAAWGIAVGEYNIQISGTADGFVVRYVWLEPGEGGEVTFWVEGEKDCEWALTGPFTPYYYETAEFHVDSLTDIRPTPAEMESEGK